MSREQPVVARRRRTRAEVLQLVSEFASSGMRQNEFCHSRGLSLSTLARHLKKRRWKRKRKNTRADCKLLGVELATGKPAAESESSRGLAVVLSSGRRIEVARNFDVPTCSTRSGLFVTDGRRALYTENNAMQGAELARYWSQVANNESLPTATA